MMVVPKQSSRHKMWTEITRRKYEREGQRYASDLTDAEWALIEPHMPAAKRLGRKHPAEAAGSWRVICRNVCRTNSGGFLRGEGVRDRRRVPVPGQQLVQPSSRVVGDPAQHVGEPGLRVDVVELGSGYQRVDCRGPLAAAIGTGEEPVLAADGNTA